MTIEKLGKILHGQMPFADTDGKGKQRIRWYVACEEWQPDKDVAVRYHQPVVGRRTVTKKALAVYVALTRLVEVEVREPARASSSVTGG